MEIRIIEYINKYEKGVEELILPIQNQEFQIPVTINDQPDLKMIPSFYQTGKGNFWVALEGELVVGTIGIIDIGENNLALRKMFVHKNFRGGQTGIAKQLLQTVLDWSSQKTIEHIYLGTIDKLVAAQKFYEKNGFHQIPVSALPKTFPVMKVDNIFYQYTCKQ